ncbi:hypothetical protein GCM10020331_071440 [Ectobacillus funiculus]
MDEIAELTGVPVEQIRKAGGIFGREETGMIFLQQEELNSKQMAPLLFVIFSIFCLLRVKMGKPYCGYGAVTGQSNGQGAREHGQKGRPASRLPFD